MIKREPVSNPLDREFIRILTDFGFKRVFGSKERSNILRRFLNALFEGEMHIEKVEYRDKELLPEHITGKKIMYDIYCTTETGRHFILEMQQEESENFPDRILFYVSKAVVNQGVRGVEYEIYPVVCIVLVDFHITGMSETLVKDIVPVDRHTGEVYSDKMRMIFISLPEVPEEWDECDTELLRQLYLIKNMENMTRESKPYLTGDYEEMFTASSTGNLSNEEAVAYSQSYLKELDSQSAIRFAERRSLEKGIGIGYDRGMTKGLMKGMEKGMEKGREDTLNELSSLAKSLGLSDDMMKKLFGSQK
ncbi:MAG: Rpn family recombination-promoting nuclease/putative transposase [Muribaculaceae bacterium]|nr:Rpn family recombination-promoting nuclease/putative transposase [Muribaculaceae bacterium]